MKSFALICSWDCIITADDDVDDDDKEDDSAWDKKESTRKTAWLLKSLKSKKEPGSLPK